MLATKQDNDKSGTNKDAKELVAALRKQCEMQLATAAVGFRNGPLGTHMALIRIAIADVNAKVGTCRVAWSEPIGKIPNLLRTLAPLT